MAMKKTSDFETQVRVPKVLPVVPSGTWTTPKWVDPPIVWH